MDGQTRVKTLPSRRTTYAGGNYIEVLLISCMFTSFQIYIGGPTLANGYLNRPELNAKRFIKRPESVPSKFGERYCNSFRFNIL